MLVWPLTCLSHKKVENVLVDLILKWKVAGDHLAQVNELMDHFWIVVKNILVDVLISKSWPTTFEKDAFRLTARPNSLQTSAKQVSVCSSYWDWVVIAMSSANKKSQISDLHLGFHSEPWQSEVPVWSCVDIDALYSLFFEMIFEQNLKEHLSAHKVKCLGKVNEGKIQWFLLLPVLFLQLPDRKGHIKW